jgi:hypothetical protein
MKTLKIMPRNLKKLYVHEFSFKVETGKVIGEGGMEVC